jgi:hypothetical protein
MTALRQIHLLARDERLGPRHTSHDYAWELEKTQESCWLRYKKRALSSMAQISFHTDIVASRLTETQQYFTRTAESPIKLSRYLNYVVITATSRYNSVFIEWSDA